MGHAVHMKASEMDNLRLEFTLEQAMKIQSGSSDIYLLSFKLCARLLWVINVTLRLL